jgi:hypothetical protein
MKLFYCLICIPFFTISCKEAIKNDVKFVAEQSFEEIQFVEPKVSNSLVVNSKEDLLGYWVGDFKADISEEKKDSIYQENNYNLLNRKITFSIDEIKGDSIFGHSITAGNISLFKGVVFQNKSKFVIKADEFKKSKYDGLFEMNIIKNDSLLIGNWEAYNPKELKVVTRKYNLQKKIFTYLSSVLRRCCATTRRSLLAMDLLHSYSTCLFLLLVNFFIICFTRFL